MSIMTRALAFEQSGHDTAFVVYHLLRALRARHGMTALPKRAGPYLLGSTLRSPLARRAARRAGHRDLVSLSLSPTVACNLRCELCYNHPENHLEPDRTLPAELMIRVVGEAKALGAYRVSVIGGEPLLCFDAVHATALAHPAVLFTIMTNGLLLTPERARALASLPNVELCFSVDGFRETNDRWRGAGTFEQVLPAMARYRDLGGMLLFSPTLTRQNYREVLSDDFMALMVEHGAYMGYLHHYDLVGGQSRSDLLLDREQLGWVRGRIDEIHQRHALAVVSNVVGTILSGGCAAANGYLHVNHRGEVEPCCMLPFAADSIVDQPLAAALDSAFFKRLSQAPRDARGNRAGFGNANSPVVRAAIEHGEAHPTTRCADQVLDCHRAGPDGHLPTCFSWNS